VVMPILISNEGVSSRDTLQMLIDRRDLSKLSISDSSGIRDHYDAASR
jgi:hypothetical protein